MRQTANLVYVGSNPARNLRITLRTELDITAPRQEYLYDSIEVWQYAAMFQPGDKVHSKEGCPGTLLVPGTYIVEVCRDGFVYVVGITGGWLYSRFELIKRDEGYILSEIDV